MSKLIDEAVESLVREFTLPAGRVRDYLAPLAEAVECVEMLRELCPRGELGAIVLSQGSNEAWRVTRRAKGQSFQLPTLHAALKAAVEKMREEASDVEAD